MGRGGYALKKEGGLHMRYIESGLPRDIQAEMLVNQSEMDAGNPRREIRPEVGSWTSSTEVSKRAKEI